MCCAWLLITLSDITSLLETLYSDHVTDNEKINMAAITRRPNGWKCCVHEKQWKQPGVNSINYTSGVYTACNFHMLSPACK